MGLVGLIASFFTIIYAYGRNTFSLSRAGYFPKWLSVTSGKRKTPHVALIAGGGRRLRSRRCSSTSSRSRSRRRPARSWARCCIWRCSAPSSPTRCSACRTSCSAGSMPNIQRPYRSPVGTWGAAIAGIIAVVSLISLYSNDDYRPGVYGTLIYFVVGIAVLRHRGPAQAGALPGGGVRADEGRARPPGIGGVRHDARDRHPGRRYGGRRGPGVWPGVISSTHHGQPSTPSVSWGRCV